MKHQIERFSFSLRRILELSLLALLLASCGSTGLPQRRIPPSKEESRFAGIFKNRSNPAGSRLNDELWIDYPYLGSVDATHVELRPHEDGFEAISYQGSERRSSRKLNAGDDYRYSGGLLVLRSLSSTYENHFFLSNIDTKSTTGRTLRIDNQGNLELSSKSTEIGTNWFVPTFGSSSEKVIFERIR